MREDCDTKDKQGRNAAFGRLRLWVDHAARPGPEAMAVDEWLLEMVESPVLRVYRWQGDWGSLGYFGRLEEARAMDSRLAWVRRWTGGGTVDHRADWTYSVVIPAGEPLAGFRGAESYRVLHSALSGALAAEGIDARLSMGEGETFAAACFENPVSHDLVDANGRKLAGAGQRRTKLGLLHQGSVAGPCDPERSGIRAERLAGLLADRWDVIEYTPPNEVILRKVEDRYGKPAWTERR